MTTNTVHPQSNPASTASGSLKDSNGRLKDSHDRTPGYYRLVKLALLLLLTLLMVLSLLLGSVNLAASDIVSVLMGDITTGTAYDVIWNLRLPRTLLAALVGVHFALSGLILQSVIRNPLADPGVIGVSSGASLAIVGLLLLSDMINATLLKDSPVELSLTWLPMAAMVGGIVISALVLYLSSQKHQGMKTGISPARLALNGVAIGGILNAIVMWIVVVWGGGRTETTILWLAGSLYGRDFTHLFILLPWTVLGLAALYLIRHPLSLLRFDESQALSMGVNVARWRVFSIALAVILAASAIAVAGPVGFIGLVVPHLSRLLVGGDIKHLVSVCLLAGGCLSSGADIISRTLLSPLELPAGALTTVIGIPVLLYLLQKQSGRRP